MPAPPFSGDESEGQRKRVTWSDVDPVSDSGSDAEGKLGFPSSVRSYDDEPKRWDVLQLSDYLHKQNVPNLARFVIDNNISGHAFLRFSPSGISSAVTKSLSQQEIEQMHEQSRKLRLDALKGRIWAQEPGENEDAKTVATVPRARVRSMVQALEEGPLSTRLRERTTSTSSTSSSESGWMPKTQARSLDLDNFADDEDGASVSEPDSGSEQFEDPVLEETRSSLVSPISVDQVRTPSPQPLILDTSIKADVEPTIEDLLACSPDADGNANKYWGAKAWEEDIIGATAKRVPVNASNAESLRIDEFGAFQSVMHDSPAMEITSSTVVPAPELTIIVVENQSTAEDEAIPVSQAIPQESNMSAETMDLLRQRLAELESRIKDLEHSQVPSATAEDQRDEPSISSTPVDMDLPQYILMAGIGVCAVVGQAVLRKVMRL